jgi:hypothetical protein
MERGAPDFRASPEPRPHRSWAATERDVGRACRGGRHFFQFLRSRLVYPGCSEFQMPVELDPKIAEDIAFSAIGRLQPMRGGKVVSSRAALRATVLEAIHEAYELGVLAAEKRQFAGFTPPGSENRPAWMDIRLDSPEGLAAHEIRIQPVVLRSLLEAGFRCLGNVRWVSSRELRRLRYVGIKTAQELRDILRRMEHGGLPESACGENRKPCIGIHPTSMVSS